MSEVLFFVAGVVTTLAAQQLWRRRPLPRREESVLNLVLAYLTPRWWR